MKNVSCLKKNGNSDNVLSSVTKLNKGLERKRKQTAVIAKKCGSQTCNVNNKWSFVCVQVRLEWAMEGAPAPREWVPPEGHKQ